MKRSLRPLLTIGLGLILALLSASLTYSSPPAMQGSFGAGAFFLQTTATPVQDDLSRVGSTDGIVVLGVFIALIIVIPILLRREAWMDNR